MASRFTELAIDCTDPDTLSRFWRDVLDYEVHDRDDAEGLVTIGPRRRAATSTEPVAPVLTFARVPEPKSVKNRLHLDVTPSDSTQDTEVRRLIDLGARRVDVGQGDAGWVVLADPEGNEFCVLAPPG